jgi:hypothetical protein
MHAVAGSSPAGGVVDYIFKLRQDSKNLQIFHQKRYNIYTFLIFIIYNKRSKQNYILKEFNYEEVYFVTCLLCVINKFYFCLSCSSSRYRSSYCFRNVYKYFDENADTFIKFKYYVVLLDPNDDSTIWEGVLCPGDGDTLYLGDDHPQGYKVYLKVSYADSFLWSRIVEK